MEGANLSRVLGRISATRTVNAVISCAICSPGARGRRAIGAGRIPHANRKGSHARRNKLLPSLPPCLPLLKREGVAAYNWGFVQGKSQTIFPWDSWKKSYAGEPPVWFHDIFRPDGSLYIPAEGDYIRSVTGKAKGK